MSPLVLDGVIKNGSIVPQKGKLPVEKNMEIKILLIPKMQKINPRNQYRGTMVSSWGNPVEFQRKSRKELER